MKKERKKKRQGKNFNQFSDAHKQFLYSTFEGISNLLHDIKRYLNYSCINIIVLFNNIVALR